MTTLASPTQPVRTGELNSASFAPRGENICKIYLDKVVKLKHSKDYERTIESSAGMIQVSNVHLMLRRLAPPDDRDFRYRARAA
jgi:hypothetical protein